MSKKRNRMEGTVVQPLRVPMDLHKQIRSLSDKARLSDADIMRLAIERGIGAVEKMFEPQTSKAA